MRSNVQRKVLIHQGKKKPIYNTSRHLQRSVNQFHQDFQDLDSTIYAESMDVTKKHYQIIPEYQKPIRTKDQVAAITGAFGLGKEHKKLYPNAAHFDLMTKLVPLRSSFRHYRTDKVAQKAIAQTELNHWLDYVEKKKEQVQAIDEYWIDNGTKKLLKECFDRMRNRDTQRVDAPDLIDVHSSFSQTFTFKVPINPRNLSQMIHPHQGYMASMPNRGYTWDEMLQMYEMQMIASYEKAKGRYLHGEELSALSFWLMADTERKGSITEAEDMEQLMGGLRYPDIDCWAKFREEFEFSIPENEIKDKNGKQNQVLRFDLMRQIFLDRGL